MNIFKDIEKLEIIRWNKECFSIKNKESKIYICLNHNNINSGTGFFPSIDYPLILHTNDIKKCKLIIKLNNSNNKNYLKFYNGISWCKFNFNNNEFIYEGEIKICKRLRIGFLDEAYNVNEIIFDSIELIIKDDYINNLLTTDNNIIIIKRDEIKQKFKQLEITNFKKETGFTSLICNNIHAQILHIKFGTILNVQHSFISKYTPFNLLICIHLIQN